MKNLRKCTMLSLLLFLFAIITSACGSGGGGNGGEFMYLPNFVTLSKDKFEINIGQKDKVTAYIGGIDITKDATFEIVTESNQKDTVATIDNDGTITAIAVGTANIKVSYKQAESANFNVLVKDPTIPNTEVKTNDIYYELGDDTKDINKIVVTVNGKDKTNEAQFFSSDESVVKVDRNGNITFVGEGTATIIVHVEGANDSIINIEVQKPQLDISIDETKIELGIDNKEFYIELGETEQLTVKLRDEDKTSNATYTSSDPSVVTIDENGNITALKEGEAEITVIVDGAKEAKIPVVVPHQGPVYPQTGMKILFGNTDKLDILLRGENVTSQCPLTLHKMHEDDPDVISIDEQGNITALAVGSVLITTICNGDEITIPIQVYDELTTVAKNDNEEIIQVKTKYLHEEDTESVKTILQDTGIIENKDDVQKVIQIESYEDLNSLDINIDLEDGSTVAIVQRQEDGTLKYISTETVQDKKITKNNIDGETTKEVALNILLGNDVPLKIEPYEIFLNTQNDGSITVNDGTITGDKIGNGIGIIKTTYNGKDTIIKINVYDTLNANATNADGELIELNAKILSPADAESMINLLHDTKIIENKTDVQKVVEIANTDELNNLNIDIDLADGTTVAIVQRQEDGTLKYISTENVQGKKITKNNIDAETTKEVAFNIMLGNTVPFEIDPYELIENDGIVTINDNNKTIKADATGTAILKTTIHGQDTLVKINIYDTLTTNATNSAGESIEVNTKILSDQDTANMINLLYDTKIIDNKNDVQKVILIDNIDDLNSLDIDIDLEDGTKVAILHRQEDGTLKYLSTETAQNNKITKNDIDSDNMQDILFNILVGNTVPFEINPYELVENDGVVTINANNKTIKGDKAGTAIVKTTINGEDSFIIINVGNSLTTTATNTSGQAIDVNTKLLSDAEKDDMITRLLDSGMISNENDVNDVVQMNQADGVGSVTIDIDRPDGTKVAVVGQDNNQIKFVQVETVQNGQITVNVANSNKNVFAQENANGELETVIIAGFYNASNQLIASWDTVVAWGWNYGNYNYWDNFTGMSQHLSYIEARHTELRNATKLVIPNGVTFLGAYTFAKTNIPLNTVVYPNTITSIAPTPFYEATNARITNYTINSNNPTFDSIDGIIYNEAHTYCYACPMNKNIVTIPEGVTAIGNAFVYNTATSVGPYDSNANIKLPNTIKTIGGQAFLYMSNLRWVEFPSGVEHLDGLVVQACYNINSVYIPSTVKTIPRGYDSHANIYYSFAFDAGVNLKIYIESGANMTNWDSYWNGRTDNGGNKLPYYTNISRETYRANYR